MARMNTATRLFVAALIAALVTLAGYGVQASLTPPKVEFPDKDFRTLPLEFGVWKGERVDDLTPELFNAIGADVVVDSTYRDSENHSISVHTAIFGVPDTGVYHSPMNCYRAAGWQEADDTFLSLEVPGRLSRPVRFTTWTREGQRVRTLYWFQLGEHTLFNRWDLGKLRFFEMRGLSTWPALIKVLMTIKATDDIEKDQQRLLSLAGPVYDWIAEPASSSAVAAAPVESEPSPPPRTNQNGEER